MYLGRIWLEDILDFGEAEADLIDLSDKELMAAADEGLKEEIILRTLVL